MRPGIGQNTSCSTEDNLCVRPRPDSFEGDEFTDCSSSVEILCSNLVYLMPSRNGVPNPLPIQAIQLQSLHTCTYTVASITPHSTDHHNPPPFDDSRSPPSTVLLTPEPEPPAHPPTQHEREREKISNCVAGHLSNRKEHTWYRKGWTD